MEPINPAIKFKTIAWRLSWTELTVKAPESNIVKFNTGIVQKNKIMTFTDVKILLLLCLTEQTNAKETVSHLLERRKKNCWPFARIAINVQKPAFIDVLHFCCLGQQSLSCC